MKDQYDLPESLQKWIADAAAGIEAPEKRDKEIERILRQIGEYQMEMDAWPEEQRTQRILERLGTVEDYHQGLAKERAMKAARLKKQLRALGIVSLALCIPFAWEPVQIILDVGVSYVGSLHWYAAQLFTGRLIAASLWLIAGIAMLLSSMKKD